jgi:hypothetical protein
MSEAPRRKGIRLPWLADDAEADGTPTNEPQNGQHPVEPATADEGAPASVASMSEAPPSEAAEPFLQSMVDAMRRIAEQARDDAMAALAASVEERATVTRSATELRAAELRDKADDDIARIGEREQGEIQRVHDEAAAKVDARQRQLDVQLQANTAAGEAALGVVGSRVDAFEEQLAAFFNKLSEMHDPAAFAAAVKRMPSAPVLDDATATSAAGASAAPIDRPSWPAEPEIAAADPVVAEVMAEEVAADVVAEAAIEPAVEVMAEEVAESPEPESPPVASEPEPAGEEITTQILVTGLSSFGAITSFKQSLERADGIRRVSLGLGTSGEFVFTATHAAGFDPTTAINTFEGAAQFRTEDGQLKVSVGAGS